MIKQTDAGQRASRPFGRGLRDHNLRVVVASTDIRYRQKLRAVIVRRSDAPSSGKGLFAAELIVLNELANIQVLRDEAADLDRHERLIGLSQGEMSDAVLESAETGERAMITGLNTTDYVRVEQVAAVEQIHIGENDRGSWICRVIDAGRLDALFSGRIVDVR